MQLQWSVYPPTDKSFFRDKDLRPHFEDYPCLVYLILDPFRGKLQVGICTDVKYYGGYFLKPITALFSLMSTSSILAPDKQQILLFFWIFSGGWPMDRKFDHI